MLRLFAITSLVILLLTTALSQQIEIPRIEQMPNFPQPYEMRNWKRTAHKYDSLVFDLNLTGTYLPLTTIVTSTNNYPEHNTFGIQSYVGSNYPPGMEAINVIPAVVSASLNGIDKTAQNGHNWVLYCEEYFNRRPSENVYLNGPNASSGHDWWYETMPNIFFYQLNSLYPNTGDFQYQFSTIADRWLAAVKAMGGDNTPWQKPYMNYRAFNLSDMTPLETGVKQPEAAGALAWLFFNAYTETGKEKYRIAAEWCLEFLDGWEGNPSYEIQLPYGVYIAARMNAVLGTNYDIEKMLNWCFDVGDLRGWGAIIGNWGGKDVSGLIGEAREGFPGYAFNMNGFEHAGALAPMVRYDDRFARTIAKWLLNVANASRLFYSDYLPDDMEDNEDWTSEYDPSSVIAYEALREQAAGPYGTGDAMGGGWAQTNLGLYGSSHAGILGAIIEKTNVEGILKLDLLATDYYGVDAYKTYLFYNPFQEMHAVTIELDPGQWDVWDALTNQVVSTNQAAMASIDIAPDMALMAVIIPSGSQISYHLDKAMVNDTIIDFNTGENVPNYPPRMKSLATTDTTVLVNSSLTLFCTAEDHESNLLEYSWSVNGSALSGSDSLNWLVPQDTGNYIIRCIVTDELGANDSAELLIHAVEKINLPPEILSLNAYPRIININESCNLSCSAFDPNDDELNYIWETSEGSVTGSDSTAIYQAPNTQGNYYIKCSVIDTDSASTTDSILVLVKDPSLAQTGELILKYDFNNSVWDYSNFGHHGNPDNILYINDLHGNSESAIRFYQSNSNVIVSNSDVLNCRDGISVCFWLEIHQHYDREAYPVSHGNWTNRWKISIGDRKLRFTINGTGGIIDIDSELELLTDTWYHVAAIYNGTECQLIIDKELEAVRTYSGMINTSIYDLILGQSLPGQTGFNFNGAMDNLKIFNYGISYEQVKEIYENELSSLPESPATANWFQVFPNPASTVVTIRYKTQDAGCKTFKIVDLSGKEIMCWDAENSKPGIVEFEKDISRLKPGIYFISNNRSKAIKLLIH